MRTQNCLHAILLGLVFLATSSRLLVAQQRPLPRVGNVIPSVSLFDEHGQPFSTDSLRGEYSVIVFGCLT
ncbi:MAG: hypothetical protein KDA96_01840 [Planctomycetaceae bacterium]|nr:hypothetical protein [Planctomycetaceae bacterium]